MTAYVLRVHAIVFIVCAALLCSCGGSGATNVAPTNSVSAAPAAPGAPASQWAGGVKLSSAAPAGSCEASYVEGHAEVFAESASAELQIDGTSARMVLQTSGGQKCVFSGTSSTNTLTLSARHDTCDGPALPLSAIIGILETCHTIDLLGEGPWWDRGKLLAQMDNSQIVGAWTFDVYDSGSFGPMRLTVALNFDFSR